MWPKGPVMWKEHRTLFISVAFTWHLPQVRRYLQAGADGWDKAIVGGPAVKLMPFYLSYHLGTKANYDVSTGDLSGVLQRANPQATRTTMGCIRKCSFCGIGTGKIEGSFRELADWPDLPIICDNNLLAASGRHFDKVMDRLEHHQGVDFNQGLDARLLTEHHAKRFKRLQEPQIRLALDGPGGSEKWLDAFTKLRAAGITKRSIRTYALIGFDSGPDEAWIRCEWIESHGIKVLPMWFHGLDCLRHNEVTQRQIELGWNQKEQTRIMGWYYKHRGEKPTEGGRKCLNSLG